jgi:putative nucleotidyltransferase with HDIG domain
MAFHLLKSIQFYLKKIVKSIGSSKGRQHIAWPVWLTGTILSVILVLLFPSSRLLQFADMKEGSISTRRIVAPFNFEILKTKDEYNHDREIAVREIYPLFILNKDRTQEILKEIDSFFKEVYSMRKELLTDSKQEKVIIDSLSQEYKIGSINQQYWDLLLNPPKRISKTLLKEFYSSLRIVLRDVLAVGVLDLEKSSLNTPDLRINVIEDQNEEIIRPLGNYYDVEEARTNAAEMLKTKYQDNVKFAQMGYVFMNAFLRPNMIYDEATYQKRIADAIAMVPLSRGFVYENEKIVDRNERITPEIRKKLVSLAAKMAEMGMQKGSMRHVVPTFGKIGFVLMILFLLVVFLELEQPEIIRQTKSAILFSLIIFIFSLITFSLHRLDASEYLVPTAMGAMLLATLFDTKVGYAGAAVLSVLAGALWGNDFNLMAISFFVGIVGVLVIKRVRNRSQLISAILYVIGAYIVAITFLGFLRSLPFKEILRQYPYGVMNGLLTPILTYGLLPLVESIFDITTDFSLLELSNLNYPILKQLSVQAPGTYHHSIIVGNLSETASHAVGANSLLARVGSYYHDIGKMDKAEYFVENQLGPENPHEKLTTRMSALILGNHVKKGLEMAEKTKLPSSIRDIIIQHHGTTFMSFFYQKAVAKDGADGINENDYRYPGPRPQTKEAAIVMLADVVEAATRSLKGPTHSRLKGLIDELVDGRFQEGELDESPLTLRDLEKIKDSFLTILAGIFHARIEYPDREEQKTASQPDKEETESNTTLTDPKL